MATNKEEEVEASSIKVEEAERLAVRLESPAFLKAKQYKRHFEAGEEERLVAGRLKARAKRRKVDAKEARWAVEEALEEAVSWRVTAEKWEAEAGKLEVVMEKTDRITAIINDEVTTNQ